jgi:hypothetical protein
MHDPGFLFHSYSHPIYRAVETIEQPGVLVERCGGDFHAGFPRGGFHHRFQPGRREAGSDMRQHGLGVGVGHVGEIRAEALHRLLRPPHDFESIQIWGLRRPSFILLDRENGVPTAEYAC